MDNVIRDNPQLAGLFNKLYDAIDTYDMSKVVRAALNVENQVSWANRRHIKSKAESTISRTLGNERYKNSKIRQAIQYYNRAIAYAPNNSEEMMLAYGNRSALFFSIQYFSACVEDINTCLSMGCSEVLSNKLKKRLQDVFPFTLEEGMFQKMNGLEFMNTYFRFDCKRNPDVPCASADVAFVSRDGVKRATAGGDIRPGSVVAIERAFASCPAENSSVYVTCYYCNRPDLRLQPCVGCCRALFCSNRCRDLCMKEYHSIECQIVDYLDLVYDKIDAVLMMKTAIKMSLKMNWDEFITASKDIGASRMRTATVRQTFNSEEPLSILSYDDRIEQFIEGKMFNGSLMCAQILNCLNRVSGNYFPKDPKLREEAMDAMGRLMLKLYVTFTNHVLMSSTAYDFNSKSYRGILQAHLGWFSMSSKLQHSCEPNLLVIGLNSSVALVALRTIKRGEQLTISYGEHFYDIMLFKDPLARAKQIFVQTRRFCDCHVCAQNMDSDSVVTIKMTDRQSKIFAKISEKPKRTDFKFFRCICEALDAFPTNSSQYRHAFLKVREILNIPQTKHFDSVTYL